jgi:uncharacterized membrane protein YkvA (DUF1232 family)
VVAHSSNSIDLIPDFIPVLSYSDDLIITPLGFTLAMRLKPVELLEDARIKAAAHIVEGDNISRKGLWIVVSILIVGLMILVLLLIGYSK